MSITDELRTGGIYRLPSNRRVFTEEELTAIADRIDEKHEDELTMERGRAITELGSDIALNYIKLPKDADGETIHLGDVMDNTHKDGFRAKRVTGICYHEGGKTTVEVDEDRLRWHDAHKLRHAQPDSWERIIADAAATRGDFDELVARCKRLAGEDA